MSEDSKSGNRKKTVKKKAAKNKTAKKKTDKKKLNIAGTLERQMRAAETKGAPKFILEEDDKPKEAFVEFPKYTPPENKNWIERLKENALAKIGIGIASAALLISSYNFFNKPKEIIKEKETIKPVTVQVTKPQPFKFKGLEPGVEFWKRVFTLDTSLSLVYDRKTYFVYGTVPAKVESLAAEIVRVRLEDLGNKVMIRRDRKPPAEYIESPDIILSTKWGMKQGTEAAIKRSRKYKFIEDTLKAYSLEPDLKWLPRVESEYNNIARSIKGAGGLWQFMPSTARMFGLTVRKGKDQRLWPKKATSSFAQYMRSILRKFGYDYGLALTGYNHGEYGLRLKLESVNGRELKDVLPLLGFASANFYVEFLAAADVCNNYKVYGLDADPEKEPTPAVEYITKTEPERIPLSPLEKHIFPFQEADEEHTNIPEVGVPEIYVVKRGDALERIAHEYNVKLADLMKFNNLKNHNIDVNDTLRIPPMD